MKELKNLEKTLVVADSNPFFYGHAVVAMYYVIKQRGYILDVYPVWNLEYTDEKFCKIYPDKCGERELYVTDIYMCVDSLSEAQKAHLKELDLEYSFFKDEDALERLATRLDLDLMHIGYDGEPQEGTWFTCLRIRPIFRRMLPSNLHIYSLRESDEDASQPATIEEKVFVNHYGDILTDRELPVPVQLEVDTIEYDEEGNIIG